MVTGGVTTGHRGAGVGRGTGARGQCVGTETPAPPRPAPTATRTGRLDHGVSYAATSRERVKVITDRENAGPPFRCRGLGAGVTNYLTLVHRTAAGDTRVGRTRRVSPFDQPRPVHLMAGARWPADGRRTACGLDGAQHWSTGAPARVTCNDCRRWCECGQLMYAGRDHVCRVDDRQRAGVAID
jgi:hypothetical protein